MKILSVLRRPAFFLCSLLALLSMAMPASATHLRGGTVTWRVTSTTATTYTVQFTLIESSRWSYPGTAGTCGTASQAAGTCPALNSSVSLSTLTGGSFTFGDNSATVTPTGTVTSINQAQDYLTATFVFSHTYANSYQNVTAFFEAGNRISTLKVGHDQLEYVDTIVSNYANGSPTAASPAILAVPLLATTTFNISSVVTDIDPNVNLVYRVATLVELYGPGVTSVPCPSGVAYTSPAPPGFTVTSAGEVTWITTQIATSVTSGNCGFGTPAAGDLWPAQIMVEAHNKTTNAIVTETPVDLLMEFINPVGALPTIALSPSGTRTVAIGTPVTFTATGSSSNTNAKVTLNASGIPSGATATGLNAAVTPPASSTFSWTPTSGQDGTYVVTYTATDNNLQQASASNTIVVATLPTITCPAAIVTNVGVNRTLTATVFDTNGDVLNVVWTVDGAVAQTNSSVTAYPSSAAVQYQQTFVTAGVHPIKVTATDPHGVAVSCTTSVTAFQPTSLAVAPITAIAGSSQSVTATLTTSPGGVPVSGQTVTFTFSGTGAPSSASATTDANGVATVSKVFSVPGTLSYTATFSNAAAYFTDAAGDIPAVADTATASITVTTAATSLSAPSVVANALVGSPLTVSTTLSRVSAPAGPAANEPVVFQMTAPDSTVTPATATTSAAGLATVTFTPVLSGAYSVVAQYAGSVVLQAATSATASVTAYQKTSLTLANSHGTAGAPVTLTATLATAPAGTPLAGQTVTFDTAGAGSPTTMTATTGPDGVATAQVTFANAGTFSVTATFSNPANFFTDAVGDLPAAADVANATATLLAAATSLSAPTAPASGQVGSPFTVSTTLTRVSAPSGPVAGTPFVFSFTAPDSTVITLTGTTDANGLASVSFVPLQRGIYTAAAQFAGNAGLLPATSTGASTTVYQPTSLVLAPPANGIAGAPLTLNASLSSVPGGSPLSGQTVTFTFTGSGAPSSVSVTTDVNGLASTSVVFPTYGSFTATATFSNPSGFFANSAGSPVADTATAPVTVTAAVTSLTGLTLPINALVTSPFTVSTTLNRVSAPSGAVASASVVFTFTAPDSSVSTLVGTTSATGQVSVSFTPAMSGVYSVAAQFAGNTTLQAATSASSSVAAYQRTSLALSSASGNVGSPITLSATLTAVPGGAPVAGQGVTFSFAPSSGAPSTVSAITGANGVATVSVNFTAPGSFTATASFLNAAAYFTEVTGSIPPIATTATATVTAIQIPITVTAGSYTGVYDGNAHALSACVIGSNSDGLTCSNSPAGPVGPDVSTGVVTPVIVGSTASYLVTSINGAYSITPATSAVAVSCPASVTYTGAALTPCTASVTGVGGLSQSVPVTYSANTNVGTVTASAAFGGDLDHTGSSNSASFNIAPATLTLSAGGFAGTYDGSSHALSACVVSANTAGLTCTNSPTGPVGPEVGSGTVTPVLSGPAGNYTVVSSNGTWSIAPLAVTVTAGSYTGVYDGSAHAPSPCTSSSAGVICSNNPASVGPAAVSGTVTAVVSYATGSAADYTLTLINGTYSIAQATSAVVVSCPASITYTGAALTPCTATVTGVGGLSQTVPVTYSANINVGTVTVSATFGGDLGHTGSSSSATFNITPAALTLTAGSYTGTYDGSSHALSACVVSANAVGLTCANSPTGPVGPDVGSGTVTPVLSGAAGNYTVVSTNGLWSITPLAVTVTAGSYTGTYDGSAHAASACTSSFAGVSCTNTPASVGPAVSSGTVTAVVSYATGAAADYTLTLNSGTYSITKRAASVTPNAATKLYGATNPALTGTLAGFLPIDGVVAAYTRVAGETVSGSPYTVSATLTPAGPLANYAVTYNTAAFTITKATPTVTWATPAQINYGTALSGTQLNATASVPGSFVYSPVAGTVLGGGTQTLSVTFTPTDAADYNAATATTSLVVKASTVSTGISSGTQTYPTWTNFVLGPVWSGNRPPTGTVTLYNNGVAIATLQLGGDGKAYYTTQPPLNAGVNNLTVSYSGDSVFPPGISAVTTITVIPATVNFQASCQGAQVYSGTYQCQVNLSASTSTPPVGSITYSFDGGAPVAVAINNGNAPFTVPGVPNAGNHTLILSYAGQGNYAAAPSLSRPFTTQQGQTQLQVYPSTYYTAHGSSLTVSGSATTPSSGVPVGTVTFYDNGVAIGTANVGTNGAVSLTVTNLTQGSHSYSAKYAGSTNYTAATSGTSTITAY